jgi:serine/threonine protein kinase
MSAESALLKKHGWKVLGPVGGGAAGAVFKVQKGEDGPICAAKVLRNKDNRPEPQQRFVRELESLKQLDHPAIIKIHEAHCDDEAQTYFYVMEFVEGLRPLKDFIGGTRKVADSPFLQNAERSLGVYLQLLQGLRTCEKAGIVHRDLSLGNVLVSPDFGVKIIDFGCCHVIDNETVTLTDMAVGTPGYRAPECSGHTKAEPTIKADLYSAGKILWSLVTARNTFEREKPVFNELALSRQLPDAPLTWHLHHVFAKTIRNDPNNRYKDTAKAIEHGRLVLALVRAGYPALEQLEPDGRKCPVCGVGWCYRTGYLIENQLVDFETVKRFTDDSDLKNELRSLPREVRGELLLCSYCGFGSFLSGTVWDRNMKHRETLG